MIPKRQIPMSVVARGGRGSSPGLAQGLTGMVAVLAAILPPMLLARPWGPAAPLALSTAMEVCLIAPRAEIDAGGRARALVPIGRPTLFAVGDLETVRLERGGRLAWEQRSSEQAPIRGPIAWPLAPLRPGERVLLWLRPSQAPPGDLFASIELIGAPAPVMGRGEALLRSLGTDPLAWLRAFEQELARGDLALAWALLFAHDGPSSPELDALRLEVYRRGCGSEAPAGRVP